MKQVSLVVAAALNLVTPTIGQVLYDAGTAGQPVADPTTQGWQLYRSNPQIDLIPIPDDGGSGLNAWGILDTKPGDAFYMRDVALPATFDLRVTMSITASTTDYGVRIEFQDGGTLIDNMWSVGMRVDGTDVVVTQTGWGGPTVTYVCEDGAIGYHTYRFLKTPDVGGYDVHFYFDGTGMGPMESGAPTFWSTPSIRFGTNEYVGTSFARAKFHRVELYDSPMEIDIPAPCAPTVANSTGQVARMNAFGSPLIGGDGFTIQTTALPPNQFGYFLVSFGTDSLTVPNSEGTLCLDPASISRAFGPNGALSSGAMGRFLIDLDTLQMPTNPVGPVGPGTVYFQSWFRDANPMPTSNFSDVIGVVLI